MLLECAIPKSSRVGVKIGKEMYSCLICDPSKLQNIKALFISRCDTNDVMIFFMRVGLKRIRFSHSRVSSVVRSYAFILVKFSFFCLCNQQQVMASEEKD